MEQQLGIAGKFWTTPAVPKLGWVPVQIPLVWFAVAAGIVCLVSFGRPGTGLELRLLAVGALALAAYVHLQSQAANIAAQPRAGSGRGPR